jgi:hypothetical protein
LALSILRGQKRSVREDGRRCLAYLSPQLRIGGSSNIPPRSPILVTCNHFSRPGLPAWWIVLAISAQLEYPIHWIMTSGWRFQSHPLKNILSPATSWLFRLVAQTYDFTSMPPMPPDPTQEVERARAVRRVLSFAKKNNFPVIGLAPEGRDGLDAVLQAPPPGAGRFIGHLAKLGLQILPVGFFEVGDTLCLRFGKGYTLDIPEDLTGAERDAWVSRTVMQAIANLLPEDLRGDWGSHHASAIPSIGTANETAELY